MNQRRLSFFDLGYDGNAVLYRCRVYAAPCAVVGVIDVLEYGGGFCSKISGV
jgi:hypothetical protein